VLDEVELELELELDWKSNGSFRVQLALACDKEWRRRLSHKPTSKLKS
jgi:hypothetical protein